MKPKNVANLKNLTSLTNEELVAKLKSGVTHERKVTARILEYLEEMEERKLYLKMGFQSLFQFCADELKQRS